MAAINAQLKHNKKKQPATTAEQRRSNYKLTSVDQTHSESVSMQSNVL